MGGEGGAQEAPAHAVVDAIERDPRSGALVAAAR
jgi:hypothetical protein